MFEGAAVGVASNAEWPENETTLAVTDLTKRYGATVALHSVTLDVRRGEIHALLGENGAGKSTLVKILNGIVAPDAGTIAVVGAPFQPNSLMAARATGVATAFQELSLLPNLTVAVNLALPHLVKGPVGLASTKANELAAGSVLAAYGVGGIDPRSLVAELSLAQRQQIEIVRALNLRPRLLVLDEPTAALAQPEWLFEAVERMAARGTAVLYITHRLAEVRRLCVRATVLRNGANVGTVDVSRTTDAEIFRMMVGVAPVRRSQVDRSAPVAESHAAIRVSDLGATSFWAVNFELRNGEILGVAALEGQGQRELFHVLGGAALPKGGAIEVQGRKIVLSSPARALRAGIGFMPEDRKAEGIFPGLATAQNISLSILARLRRFGFIDRSRERRYVAEEARRVDLPERYLGMDIDALSGGSQQKALVARVLLSGARTLVLFDPTRGVDVGTKVVIYDVIRRFVAGGSSVLIYSTELTELVELVDRCLVMYRGRIVGDVAGDVLSEDHLIALATGQRERGAAGLARSHSKPARNPITGLIRDGTWRAAAVYLVLFSMLAARQSDTLTISGINDLLNNALPLAIAAAGSSLVVLTRNFDLSVAGVIALTNVVMATAVSDRPEGAALGLLLALALGLAVGATNGFLVAFAGLQSVAATFATMIVCSGLALLVLGAPGGAVPHSMTDGLTGIVGGYVPAAAIIAVIVALVWALIRRSDWGIALYAVGADETAASLAGIRTRWTKMGAFCVAGVLYGLAGYALSAVTTTGDPNAGNSYLILTYAAVAIGGVAFSGGYGGLIGAMIGAATLGLLQKVLFSLGVLSFYTGIAQGIAMILAVLVGTVSARAAFGRST